MNVLQNSLNKNVEYDTGDYHYFFNLKSRIENMPLDLMELFRFISETDTYKITNSSTQLIRDLEGDIMLAKHSIKMKEDYDMYLSEIFDERLDARAEGKAEGKLTLLTEQTRECLNLGLSFTEAFDRLFITDLSMQEKIKAILSQG